MTKNIIILLLSAVLIGVILFTCNKPTPKLPVVTAPKVERVIDTVWGDTLRFYSQIKKLNRQISGLTNQLTVTKGKLSSAEQMANDILANMPQNDTTNLLKQVIAVKDSLMHDAFTQLDSIIALKDQQFEAAQQLKHDLLKSIDQLAEGSLQKDEVISYWKKQAKKQKFNKVLYKIATGAAALFIIHKAIQ